MAQREKRRAKRQGGLLPLCFNSLCSPTNWTPERGDGVCNAVACVAGGSGCARETSCGEAANSLAGFAREGNSTRLLPILFATWAAFLPSRSGPKFARVPTPDGYAGYQLGSEGGLEDTNKVKWMTMFIGSNLTIFKLEPATHSTSQQGSQTRAICCVEMLRSFGRGFSISIIGFAMGSKQVFPNMQFLEMSFRNFWVLVHCRVPILFCFVFFFSGIISDIIRLGLTIPWKH